MRQAGLALGLRDGQVLRGIELPLAAPTIFAGIKTAAVLNVGAGDGRHLHRRRRPGRAHRRRAGGERHHADAGRRGAGGGAGAADAVGVRWAGAVAAAATFFVMTGVRLRAHRRPTKQRRGARHRRPAVSAQPNPGDQVPRLSSRAGVREEQLLPIDPVARDRLLPGRRGHPVDELLRLRRLHVREACCGLTSHHAVLVEQALVAFHQHRQLAAVLEAEPGAAVGQHIGAARRARCSAPAPCRSRIPCSRCPWPAARPACVQ